MTWTQIEEKRLDKGKRNIVFVSKPNGSTFYVYNYSANTFINSFLGSMDVWATNNYFGGTPKLYKNTFEYTMFELPTEFYDTFQLNAMCRFFNRNGIELVLEEKLEKE